MVHMRHAYARRRPVRAVHDLSHDMTRTSTQTGRRSLGCLFVCVDSTAPGPWSPAPQRTAAHHTVCGWVSVILVMRLTPPRCSATARPRPSPGHGPAPALPAHPPRQRMQCGFHLTTAPQVEASDLFLISSLSLSLPSASSCKPHKQKPISL